MLSPASNGSSHSRDVFFCYHKDDGVLVEKLALHLQDKGICPWLDEWHIVPGTPWMPNVEQALDGCPACAIFVGPSGISPWQHEQMRVAINQRVERSAHRYRVIPVLLPGAQRGEPGGIPAFLRDTIWIEFHTTLTDERALHRLVCGIRGLEPKVGPTVDDSAQPYQGLEPFDVAQSRFFFGREALVDWLVCRMASTLIKRPICRFLTVSGSSGSGKSSLVRAGVLAALRHDALPGSQSWPVLVMTPGEQPFQQLAQALTPLLSRDGRKLNSVKATAVLAKDENAFERLIRRGMSDAPEDQRLVLVVDQFEELFTLCADQEQRKRFVAALAYAACTVLGRVVVVVVLRADFQGHCATLPDLADLLTSNQRLLGPLSRVELRRAIERPAHVARYEFEDELVDQILEDVGDRMELPLIQYALLRLWSQRDTSRRLLTKQVYQAIGGVQGALERHAEQVYEALSNDEQAMCRLVMLDLILVRDRCNDARRPVALSRLALGVDRSTVARVVERLAGPEARLLVIKQEQEQVEPVVQIAHETLIASWQRLDDWVNDERPVKELMNRLTELAEPWDRGGQQRADLLTDRQLKEVRPLSERNDLGATERSFLEQSIAAARWRRVWRVGGWVALAAVVLGLFGVYVWVQGQLSPWKADDIVFQINDPTQGPISVNNPANALQVSGGSSPVYYVATKDIGVGRSEDGGKTWIFETADKQDLPMGPSAGGDPRKIVSTVPYLAVDPLDPDHLLAVVKFNDIYRSDDGAKTWYESDQGIDESDIAELSVIGLDVRGGIAIAVLQNSTLGDPSPSSGKLYISRDGGLNWSENTPDSNMAVYTAVISPDGDEIFIGTSSGVYRGAVSQEAKPVVWEKIPNLPASIRIIFREKISGLIESDVLYLATHQQQSGELNILCWQLNDVPRIIGETRDQTLQLYSLRDTLYVLQLNGEVLRMSLGEDGCSNGQATETLYHQSGIMFSLMAVRRSDGRIRLLAGHESGVIEYIKPLGR